MSYAEELSAQQQREKANSSRVLHAWYGAFKNVKLYNPEHPAAHEAARKLSSVLSEILVNKLEMAIVNSDGLFIINDLFFIEESLSHYDLLHSLEERNIAVTSFLPGLTEDEIILFCNYLGKKRLPGIPDSGFFSNHIKAPILTQDTQKAEAQKFKERPFKASASYLMALDVYDEWVSLADKTFAKLLDEQNIAMGDLSESLDKLFDTLHQHASPFSVILCTTPLTNLHIQHAVHTMILSAYIGQQLSLDAGNMKMLALGSLLHDFGRLLLPADFTTGYKLMPGDVDFIQLHTRDGASFLAGVPGLPMNIVRSSLEHHIGFDNQGYPALPEAHHSHFLSQIIGLADFASWATVSEEYYHKPVPPLWLVRTLMARAGTQFDPFLVKVLLPFYGLYPPGTRVKLNSGEVAIAVEPNIRNIGRPLVACRSAKGGWESRWLNTLADEGSTSPYRFSVEHFLGHEKDMKPFLQLISEDGGSQVS